jgi:hypothetical protein
MKEHEHDLEYDREHNYTIYWKCRYPECDYEEMRYIECL